ncbi:MAG TPA: hypothetical protein PLB55_13005, partial [Prosthecobacter sp.]|nr:hypothetical protein [Prosthecobacter sp.]
LPDELLELAKGGGKMLLRHLREARDEPHPAWNVPAINRDKLKRFRRSKYFHLECGYEDVMAAAKPAFSSLLKDLIALPTDVAKEARLDLFHACMVDLNEVNNDEDLDQGIDTEECDFFCGLLEQIAHMAGLDNIDDVLAQRDW